MNTNDVMLNDLPSVDVLDPEDPEVAAALVQARRDILKAVLDRLKERARESLDRDITRPFSLTALEVLALLAALPEEPTK